MNKFGNVVLFGVCLTGLLIGGVALAAKINAGFQPQSISDASGNLHLPENYRTAYQYLGSWSIAADKGSQGAAQMHQVYASPGAIDAYQKLGHFPDGTVLVKEVYEAATAPMTTGTVSHINNLKGWFVMVKAAKNPHPDSKFWGDGWGWSWFDAGQTIKTTTKDYKSECLGCHVPAKGTDWIYVQGYPILRK
jgi:hypothetical protein